MSPEEQAAGRAALERMKAFAAGKILAYVYPDTLDKLGSLRQDMALVLGALRRKVE